MSLHHYFRNLLEGKRNGPDAWVLIPLLGVLSVPYRAVMYLRTLAYRSGVFRTRRLPKPVVSVGNITAGGTGKTPVVSLIARYYLQMGKKVAVLSRGYGGSLEGRTCIVSDGKSVLLSPEEAGDEPCMLARNTPGLMVIIGSDRYRSGLHVLEKLDPDVFILDDGFQHQRLHRDLNILLMDHSRPLGNGRVLPAGLLREPLTAIKRADLLIFTRCGGRDDRIPPDGVQVCHAFYGLKGFTSLDGNDQASVMDIAAMKGVAFAGIGDPDSFFDLLEKSGLDIKAKIRFPDHCGYGEKEIEKILSVAGSVESDYLVTTEKDSVKLAPYLARLGRIYSASLDLEMPDLEILEDRLKKLLL